MISRRPGFWTLTVTTCLLAASTAKASLESCVAGLRNQAVRAGVGKWVVQAALGNVKFDENL